MEEMFLKSLCDYCLKYLLSIISEVLKSLFIIYLSAGFNSLFLYRRLYRSHTALHGFSFDNGTVERKKDLSIEEFYHQYDGKKPVTNNGSHMINYIFLGPLFSKSSCAHISHLDFSWHPLGHFALHSFSPFLVTMSHIWGPWLQSFLLLLYVYLWPWALFISFTWL